jgi:hypothetical protein
MPAMGQRFMPQEIIQADPITPEMNDTIVSLVDPPVYDMGDDEVELKKVTEARDRLKGYLNQASGTAAFRMAVSTAISGRIGPAVDHENAVVRMNAMIVLGDMVDPGSKALIDKGLVDKNDAVQHWAMIALGKRMQYWQKQLAALGPGGGWQANMDTAVAQIKKLLLVANPPHPIVVGAGLDALVKADTQLSREALIEILNQRVALHAADPNLKYTAERAVCERFTNVLVAQVPPDVRSIKGYSRALSRYSSLIVDQAQANLIDAEVEGGAHSMLFVCLQGMANVSAAAQAPNSPPANHNQGRDWIKNARWAELKELVDKDWNAILQAAPFSLDEKQLAVKQ